MHTIQNHDLNISANEAVARAWKRISTLDLTQIVTKLTDLEHGSGWPAEKAQMAERHYRCFLCLQSVYGDSEIPIVPLELADDFWHQHILDTRKYVGDCQAIFGRYLHHYPYFGMRGADDARALTVAAERTLLLLEKHFPSDAKELVGPYSTCRSCASCYVGS